MLILVKTGMLWPIDRELAEALAILCRVREKLRVQVVGSPKVVGSEHPSLEITLKLFLQPVIRP